MIKPKLTQQDEALLADLDVNLEPKQNPQQSEQQERIVAGFEDIEHFVNTYGRPPQHNHNATIFERLYAARLDTIRGSTECRNALADSDNNGLLHNTLTEYSDSSNAIAANAIDDDALLAELGVSVDNEHSIATLIHVPTRTEKRAVDDVAQRKPCLDFNDFKPLFDNVQNDLKSGVRTSRRFKEHAKIQQGELFILGGQITYVAHIGKEIKTPNGARDARLRVIYDNGTESDLLLRSLQRALYKDTAGRRIGDPFAGPLFADQQEHNDIESGTIYVLRSKSQHPDIKKHYQILHKIGVTSGDIENRIIHAKDDPTFLMSEVTVVATYKLANINRVQLESIIHKFFESARLTIAIKDRFGKAIIPREWFLVPLFIIDEAVSKIKEGTIVNYRYDSDHSKIQRIVA